MLCIILCYFLILCTNNHGVSSKMEHENIIINISQIPVETSLLEHICSRLNISTYNCSCDHMSSVCVLQRELRNESVVTSYRRLSTTTIVYASVTLVFSVFGAIANFLVLLVAYRQRKCLQSGKLHIAELAAVNLIFCLLQLMNIMPLYWTNMWLYGRSVCKLVRSLMELSSFLTIGFVVIIAIERYLLVNYPLKRVAVEKNLRHSLVIGNFVISIVTVVPYLVGLDVDRDGRCVIFINQTKNMGLPYHCFVLVIYMALPVCVTTTIYISILRSLSTKKFNKQFSDSSIVQQRIRATKNRRIVWTTMVTLVAFLLCNLPTRVISMYLLSVHYKVKVHVYMVLVFVAYVTYPLQSALNPILYSMLANQWRCDMKCVAQSSSYKFVKFIQRITGLRSNPIHVQETEV